jgi:hypothetical protein
VCACGCVRACKIDYCKLIGADTDSIASSEMKSVLLTQAKESVAMVEEVVKQMAADGNPYRGVLYAGLMLTPEGSCVCAYSISVYCHREFMRPAHTCVLRALCFVYNHD